MRTGRRIDADAVFVGADALLPGEHLFVYSADICIVCLPEQVTTIHRLLEQLLEHYARIQVHLGKIQVCGTAVVMSLQGVKHCRRQQSAWIRMPGCGEEEGSQTTSKGSECWASQWATLSSCKPSSCLPPRSSCLPPRSTRPSTNASSLFRTCRARGFFSSSARTPRATYSLRCTPPNEVAEFAAGHDEASWQWLTKLLGFPRDTDRHNVASLSFDFQTQ